MKKTIILFTLLAALFFINNTSYSEQKNFFTNSSFKTEKIENLYASTSSGYGEISTETGRPKTVHVNGYYRKDGTYVQPHYRSSPKRK